MKIDKPQKYIFGDVTPHNSNTVDLEPVQSSPSSSATKRPMGRDAAKEAKKKALSTPSEYAAKMLKISIQKNSLFKETETGGRSGSMKSLF